MFYKGSGCLNSMFFESISAAQKSAEKHKGILSETTNADRSLR